MVVVITPEYVRQMVASIVKDGQLRKEMTQGQSDDAVEKTKTNTDGARKAVRGAWSHIFYPVRSDTAGAGDHVEGRGAFLGQRGRWQKRSHLRAVKPDLAEVDGRRCD